MTRIRKALTRHIGYAGETTETALFRCIDGHRDRTIQVHRWPPRPHYSGASMAPGATMHFLLHVPKHEFGLVYYSALLLTVLPALSLGFVGAAIANWGTT